jgi:opacity protein-like surface antigen
MNWKCLVFVLLCLFSVGSFAADLSSNKGPYIGLFGGFGSVASASMQQQGKVLNLPRPLPIHASGSTPGGTRISMGGVQLGYEWDRLNLGLSAWGLKPAAELEGFYIGKYTPTGELRVIPRALGTQYVSAPTTAGVVLANAVFNFQTPYSNKIFPYIGVGAGVAFLSIKGSDSANPSEPGINHFNSDPDASNSAFAMQFKAGLKGEVYKNLYFFTEYRHLSVNGTSYTFGATDYPGVHLPTTLWRVNLGRQRYNMVVAGLQYRF